MSPGIGARSHSRLAGAATRLESVTNPLRPGPAGIQLAGLVKNFRGPTGEPIHAVRGVDISIAPGETVALLGPNGAGKSTTVDMMLGLSKPNSGHVNLFGGPPAQAVQRGQIGAMLQTGGVLRDLSVREIVAMMGALFPNPLPVDDVLAMAGLSDIADQRTQKLSGGQSQRVRFAVALVSDPDLLVLDEPTVAMDVEARNAFWATMRAFASQGKTVIFATHYLEEADAYADRIILMARGRVVADGATTEIKSRVGGKTIRVTLPGVPTADLGALSGVAAVDTRGDAVFLHCNDSDRAIRALLAAYPAARDIEITGAGLEQAFLALTGEDEDESTEIERQGVER
jgi:ABC-2 type transport system ATP-binding protein